MIHFKKFQGKIYYSFFYDQIYCHPNLILKHSIVQLPNFVSINNYKCFFKQGCYCRGFTRTIKYLMKGFFIDKASLTTQLTVGWNFYKNHKICIKADY